MQKFLRIGGVCVAKLRWRGVDLLFEGELPRIEIRTADRDVSLELVPDSNARYSSSSKAQPRK